MHGVWLKRKEVVMIPISCLGFFSVGFVFAKENRYFMLNKRQLMFCSVLGTSLDWICSFDLGAKGVILLFL